MKNYLTALLLILVSSVSAQEYYTYSGGKIRDSKDQKVSSREIKNINFNNFELVENYKSGRRMQQIGGGMIGFGGGIILSHVFLSAYGDATLNGVPLLIGGAIAGVGVVINLSGKKKVTEVVHMMNDDVKNRANSSRYIKSSQIIANSNGVGLSLTF